jgi:hypothetical protein
MIQNPLRWRARYRNYELFARSVEQAGAVLYTAEIAFEDRPFEITSASNPRHLQLRTRDELWLKENALNLLAKQLPTDARYVAWIDADVLHARPDWADETVEQLRHFRVVQTFQWAQDLDADYNPMPGMGGPRIGLPPGQIRSYGWGIRNDYPRQGDRYAHHWHPGFSWAARREMLDELGGLFEYGVTSSGDWIMAHAFIGHWMMANHYSDSYNREIEAWSERATRVVAGDVGYVPGLLLHLFHGVSRGRAYETRIRTLTADVFDPDRDLTRDESGLFVLNPKSYKLREYMRFFNRLRREDG